MAEELQGLLNRIQEDGLQKSETQRAKIIADAEAQAAQIVADAKAKADQMIKDAESAARSLEEKTKAAIQQAARDILLALKGEILARLQNVVRNCTGEAMTPAVMSGLIVEMVRAYAAGAGDQIELILPESSREKLELQLKASLAWDLQARTKILGGGDFSSGLQIGFRDGDVFLDCSDEAFADLICSYLGPKITALLKN